MRGPAAPYPGADDQPDGPAWVGLLPYRRPVVDEATTQMPVVTTDGEVEVESQPEVPEQPRPRPDPTQHRPDPGPARPEPPAARPQTPGGAPAAPAWPAAAANGTASAGPAHRTGHRPGEVPEQPITMWDPQIAQRLRER